MSWAPSWAATTQARKTVEVPRVAAVGRAPQAVAWALRSTIANEETNGAMLKITQRESGSETILRLEGRLAGTSVNTLQQEWRRLNGHATAVAIDLRDVGFADAEGLALLRRLERRGVRLLHPTPFLAEALGATED